MTLTLAQWIAFTRSALASTERLIEAETDPTALLILRSGLNSLHQQMEVLLMTDKEFAAAQIEADSAGASADYQRLRAILVELHRRSQLTSHELMAEAVERRRLRAC